MLCSVWGGGGGGGGGLIVIEKRIPFQWLNCVCVNVFFLFFLLCVSFWCPYE